MIIPLIRTLILYFLVVSSMRIMGKRQIGEMQPSELVVAIMISDLASIPMQEVNIPLLSGIVPVLTLLFCEMVMSYLCMKSSRMRKLFTGEPSIIIYGGRLITEEMRRLRFSLADLIEQLRINGCDGIGQVEVAVLETNGQLSVIKKKPFCTVNLSDIGIKDRKSTLPCLIISDGEINKSELECSGKSEEWLIKELEKRGIKAVREVFYLELSDDGINMQRKE